MTHSAPQLPSWVTEQSVRYLAHTEAGRSIRGLARDENCHPSTILRQIRRVETRRDDPLVDEVLNSLGRIVVKTSLARSRPRREVNPRSPAMSLHSVPQPEMTDALPSDAELERDAPRVLRRLCEPGAVLALAADMDKAVVVRDAPDGTSARIAVVDRAVAQAMALNEWIACQSSGRITRYTITQTGRSALNKLMAQAESSRISDRETPAGPHRSDTAGDEPNRRARYGVVDSPVTVLARRKGPDGKPFLADDLVAAGERLREDFELAQVGSGATQNWDRLLTGGVRGGTTGAGLPPLGHSAAQDRVLAALQDLGPGLGDVALRCCCFLEGLETAEKKLGWSARSGKIVLRIALQRLKRHYADLSDDAMMIG